MSNIKVGISSLTNTIYAGRLNKAQRMWKGEKFDVTDDCVNSMIGYIQKATVIYERDGKRYQLKEVELVDSPHTQ